jgi:hypothetical protein
MSDTLNKIRDFHRQIFQNIQLTITFNYIDCHSSLELLSSLELHACLISSSFVGNIVLLLFKHCFLDRLVFDVLHLHLPSTNIEIKCNKYIYIYRYNRIYMIV